MTKPNYPTGKLKFLRFLPIQFIKPFICTVWLFLPLLTTGQTGLWQMVNNAPVSLGSPLIAPEKYQLLKLDAKMMQGLLNTAPMEMTLAAQTPGTVIDIPMPDGTMQRFVIVESPIMEPVLAQKFPDIKTYGGYSVQNPATTIRVDFTPAGFHAMILSPEGTFFVDPFNKSTVEYYISYNKKDYTSTKKSIKCLFGSPAIDSNGIQKRPNNQLPTLDLPTKVGASFTDGSIRTYRLALAATAEYTQFHGGTIPLAAAAQATTMNRVNGIYLKDFSVKMVLVANNNLLIYTNAITDPYSNYNAYALLDENQANLDLIIGPANYDIGHVFTTGGGGLAGLGVVCNSSYKAQGETGLDTPIGDAYDVDYVAHEIGHQFGGNHTFNNDCFGNINYTTAFEPGSGTTIMAYAGVCDPNIALHSDDYFHGGSLEEMQNFILGGGNTCVVKQISGNASPVINSYTLSQTIPKNTPFFLTGNATDANGNGSLTYCWEQMDIDAIDHPASGNETGGPFFRSLPPTTSNTRYFPKLSDLVNNTSSWEVLPLVARTFKFRLVVRDNVVAGGRNDHKDITLTIDGNSGPFVVTAPNTLVSWQALTSKTVTWSVANTNLAPINCTNVDILLSTDGGLTYPTTLASNVPNNGSASITVPNISSASARVMVRGTGKIFFDISNSNFIITCQPVIPTATSASRCGTGTVTLTANGCIGTLNWYSAVTGGVPLASGTSYTTPSLSTSTNYYAECINGACASSRVTATATITNVSTPTTTGANRCGTGSVSLTATGCPGGTLNWYTGVNGGSSINAGTSYTTPSLPATTTYYVSCTIGNCSSSRVAVTASVLINATFTGSQIAGTYRASNTIVSNANVATGTSYYAVKSIQLNPGFQAGGQEVFLAKTEACSN